MFLAACQQDPEHRRLDPETRALLDKHDADVPALVAGNNAFALALYQQLAAGDGNLCFSPYSTSNALAMTYAGARGHTAAAMKAVLRFCLDDERLHPTFGNLILRLEGDGTPRPFQLDVANRLWGQKGYGFVPAFLKVGRDFQVVVLVFSPKGAAANSQGRQALGGDVDIPPPAPRGRQPIARAGRPWEATWTSRPQPQRGGSRAVSPRWGWEDFATTRSQGLAALAIGCRPVGA